MALISKSMVVLHDGETFFAVKNASFGRETCVNVFLLDTLQLHSY